MGLFGNLFDFNRDGKTSFTEQMVGLGLAAGLLGLLEEEDRRQRELAIDIEIEEENEEEALYERLDELRDELFDLEWEEPDDISSEEYDEWNEKRQALEEEIEKLEEMLGE